MAMNRILFPLAVIVIFLTGSTPAIVKAASVIVRVPGTSNPWLAGMLPGATDGDDAVPGQSPAFVANIDISPGAQLRFSATGGVINDNQSPLRYPPDGEHGAVSFSWIPRP